MYMLHIHTNRYIVLIGLATINTKIDFSNTFSYFICQRPKSLFYKNTNILLYNNDILIYHYDKIYYFT